MLIIKFHSEKGQEHTNPITVAKALVNTNIFTHNELKAIGEHLLIESEYMRKQVCGSDE